MNNIIYLTPRIEASRLSNLSTLHNGRVDSDKALKLINECLRRLNNRIERTLERENERN